MARFEAFPIELPKKAAVTLVLASEPRCRTSWRPRWRPLSLWLLSRSPSSESEWVRARIFNVLPCIFLGRSPSVEHVALPTVEAWVGCLKSTCGSSSADGPAWRAVTERFPYPRRSPAIKNIPVPVLRDSPAKVLSPAHGLLPRAMLSPTLRNVQLFSSTWRL